MKRADAARRLKVLCVICSIIGIVMVGMGFYKYLVYANSKYGSNVNAYVGGDAYNYIINGTYFIAYAVLGMGFFVIATISGVASMFMSVKDNKKVSVVKEKMSTIQDIEANLPKM